MADLLAFLGQVALLSTLFGYLGRKVIDAYINGRLERHKADLEKETREYLIRFERLHTERAEIIKEAYRNLEALDEALATALAEFQAVNEPEPKEQLQTVAEKFNDLRMSYVPNRIFFEENTCSKFDDLLRFAREAFIDATTYPIDTNAAPYRVQPSLLDARHEFWEKARNKHRGEIKTLKQSLASEFRSLLGIGTQQIVGDGR